MVIFTFILTLQVLIVGLGVLTGYKRGIGRGIVRLVELILIAVASLVLGRAIAAKIADAAFSLILPLLGQEIGALISSSESLSALIVGFVGALLVPVLFAVFFALLGLITKILLKKRSMALTKLVLGYEEDTTRGISHGVGMAVGALSASLVALALFSPLHTALSFVGGLSDESVALIGSLVAPEEVSPNTPSEQDTTLSVHVSLLKREGLDLDRILRETREVYTVATPLSLKLATATTPEGKRYNAVEEAVVLTNAASAAATVINEENKVTDAMGKPAPAPSPVATLTKVASAALPHIAGQPFSKELVATVASTAGRHLRDGGEIAGISLNTGDEMADIMISAISEVFSNTTTENLSATTATLFGVDLDEIEEEKKAAKETEKEAKRAEKEAAKESKKAEKESGKETKPETTKAPVETTTVLVETTTEPVETTTEPVETTTKPVETTTEPVETTTAPAETTAAPEETEDPKEQTQKGAIEVLAEIDLSNASGIFEDEAQCRLLIEAVYIVSENPTFKPFINALGKLGKAILSDYSNQLLPNLNDETVDELYTMLQDKLAAEAFYTNGRPFKDMVPSVKSSLLWLSQKGEFEMSGSQAELGAICIVARFFTPENIQNPAGVSRGEFENYLGY